MYGCPMQTTVFDLNTAQQYGALIDYRRDGVVLTGEFSHVLDHEIVVEADEGKIHYIVPADIERIYYGE